ncbi:hypothetical protein HOY82DRAFT_631473 [Tuber indicum]|nr:hypothetical protein HOY82DRAFT_631473 [Tuber indicum]
MAVRSRLKSEIPNVNQVQLGSQSEPEVAYANEAGLSLLRSVRSTESEVLRLREELHKLKDACNQQNEEHNSLKEKFEIHQAQCKKHEMELAVLRPLRDPAVGIRERFFLNYEKHQRSNRGSQCPEDLRTLAGNNIAHGGDVITDIVLLRNNLIKFLRSFKALYGLFLHQADQLTVYPHMVTVMNLRATVMADSRCDWTKETEDKFWKLVEWTRYATPKALHEFTEDLEGKTSARRQFYELVNFKPSRQ